MLFWENEVDQNGFLNEKTIRINALPAFTYNWLRMNEAEVAAPEARHAVTPVAEVPADIREDILTEGRAQEAGDTRAEAFSEIRTGAGKEMEKLVADSGLPVRVYTAAAGVRTEADAVRLTYDLDGADGAIDRVAICAEKDAGLTVVMDFRSAGDAAGAAAIQAEAGATVRLVQIQRLGDRFTFLNDIGGTCAEDARIELVELILSGKDTYHGCRIDLPEARGSFASEIGYLVEGDGHLDINYDVKHIGEKTACEMNANGVLRDRAFKIFRGTIDFQNGCAGATGDEMEDVLLMDDTVVNQSIPLILCAEEDVVGNHGATIGRLDEELMFYMESRGMNREEVYEMMAKARIDAVIRKIPDEKTRGML